MADIIKHDFQKQEGSNTRLLFLNSKITADAKVYAYYLLDLVEEINSHFWNNYHTLKIDLEHYHAYQFDNQIKFVKKEIKEILECLNDGANSDLAYNILKSIYDSDIANLLEWLEKIDLAYRQTKIIDINNYTNINNSKF